LNDLAVGKCSGDCSLVPPWRDAELPDEGTCHMALVSETRQKCSIYRGPTCGQQPPDETHSALDQISMRRCPNFAGETAQELEPAHA